jgi:propionyl-CoA synthetase
VGHSFIVYAPLLLGCTSVMYEGKPVGTPDASAFWRVCSQHRVNTLFTAPTAFRAIKREDSRASLLAQYDLKAAGFRALYLAGERADPDTIGWAENVLQVPVYDNFWQTETGVRQPAHLPITPPVHSRSPPPLTLHLAAVLCAVAHHL